MKKIMSIMAVLCLSSTTYAMQKNITMQEAKLEAVKKLVEKYPAQMQRIALGVSQASKLWTDKDGTPQDFEKFCVNNFFTGPELEKLFKRFEQKLEYISGHLSELTIRMRWDIDVNSGKNHPVDQIFASYDPAAHFIEDMFKTKLAFIALLNFKIITPQDMLKNGKNFTRKQWAEARLMQVFAHRVPSEVMQERAKAEAKASAYVGDYKFEMDHISDKNGKPMFRKGLKLLSHWGLRDELKGFYSEPKKNLKKQETIYKIMQRVIAQEVPKNMIDNAQGMWEPYSNTVDGKPAQLEDNNRFKMLLDVYKAISLSDKYYPDNPSHYQRRFNLGIEIPEEQIEKMFEQVLLSKEAKKVARIIRKRLKRKLQPFDIWYNGFVSRGGRTEQELDKLTQKKYPTVKDFAKQLADILVYFGFSKSSAKFIASKTSVEPARGSAHSYSPQMRGNLCYLRVNAPEDSTMNFQALEGGLHELGHCVEGVNSLYGVDSVLLSGVPSTGFSEAFAFAFENRALELLGIAEKNKKAEASEVINSFWDGRHIMGVGLVDMKVWRWLYKNPNATAEELKNAVSKIAKDIWNKYFSFAFGIKDSPVLAIYSHMISYPLYLPNYPIGHVITFQVEDYFKTHPLSDFERMARQGRVTPNLWMKGAVGADVSSMPLVSEVKKALKIIKK